MYKKTIQLLIILCAMAAIFYMVHRRQGTEKAVSYFNFDSTRVGRIDISNLEEKVILRKTGDKWELISPVKWDVNKDQLNLFFSKVIKVKVTKSPMSEDIKNQDKYRVTPDKSIVLTIYDKRMHLIDRVFLGKSLNSSFCYSRRPGSNAIYQLKDNIYDDVIPSVFLWRSPVIASVELPNLISVDVKYLSNQYRLILENQVWYYKDSLNKFQLDPTNLTTAKLFNALTSLQSFQFIDNRWSEFEPIFKKPAAIITITDKYGKNVKLTFAVGNESIVYLMKNDDTRTLYTMNIDMLNRFTKAPQHFRL